MSGGTPEVAIGEKVEDGTPVTLNLPTNLLKRLALPRGIEPLFQP